MTSQPDDNFIQVGEDFLEHFGIQGMRWGHRNVITESNVEINNYKKSHAGALAALTILGVAGAILTSQALKSLPSIPPPSNEVRSMAVSKIFKNSVNLGKMFGEVATIK